MVEMVEIQQEIRDLTSRACQSENIIKYQFTGFYVVQNLKQYNINYERLSQLKRCVKDSETLFNQLD
jgi:hypothetical protein